MNSPHSCNGKEKDMHGLRCPRDGMMLQLSDYKKVTIDFCPYCNGSWLDAKELAEITKKSRDTFVDDESDESRPKSTFKCPRCSGEMVITHYTGKKDVEIDRCRSCGGIWLDTDELKAILQIAKAMDDASA
jgi:Zn-finger nucleic acid-binding protein